MKCPICKNEVEDIKSNKYFPFCSNKCKMIDLYNWMNGEYYIKGESNVNIQYNEKFSK